MILKKLNVIQLVRALAILFIMMFHANYMFNEKYSFDVFNISNWGRSGGLDLFFLISGLMIYYINKRYIGNRSKVAEFLKKRIFKIAPLYWMLTIFGFSVCFIIPELGDIQDRSINNFITSLLFLNPDPIVGVAWSLRHIILFYLVFCFLIAFPKTMKKIILAWVALCLLNTFKVGIFENLNNFFFSYNNVEIWLGVYVGYLSSKIKLSRDWIFLCLGILVYISIWVNSSLELVYIEGTFVILCYSVAAALILLGSISMDLKRDIHINKQLAYLGDASYSIFLTHVQVLQFLMIIFDRTGLYSSLGYGTSLVIIIITTPLFGVLAYTILEKPINSYLKKRLVTNKKNISFEPRGVVK